MGVADEPAPEGKERGEGQAAIVLVVTERPERFSELRVPGRAVRLWGAPGAGGGDPADPDSYRALENGGRPLTAVLDVGDDAAAVLRALGQRFPDAAALVLCHGERPAVADGVVCRCVPPQALFARELASELGELEAVRRARLLRRFAEDAETVPILVQRDPDPDALASALAVRALLQRTPAEAPIISLGELTRPENRRMAGLLDIAVSTITKGELKACDRVVAVDVQPPPRSDAPGPRWAVIDHHPPEGDYDAEFLDIRQEVGAAATMLTEYLRAQDERRVGERLATALLYGIRTDTAALTRGVTAADAAAYVFLQERADPELLVRIERRANPPATVRRYGEALSRLCQDDDLLVVDAGRLRPEEEHIVTDLADFCLSSEGIRWSAAAATTEGGFTVALRHLGGGPGAGELAGRLAQAAGEGGGHASMARWGLDEAAVEGVLGRGEPGGRAESLARHLRGAIDALE